MITRCNQCGTKFEISAQVLEADDASVRCGECMAVFDARAELVDELFEDVPMLTKTAGPSDDVGSTQVAEQKARVQSDYAIDEVDLETADTLVIERSYQEDASSPAQAQYTGATSKPWSDSADAIEFAADSSVRSAAREGRRVDPVIGGMDDMPLGNSLEFEETLALDGVTGIESSYGARGSRAAEGYREDAMETEALAANRPKQYATALDGEYNPARQEGGLHERGNTIQAPLYGDDRDDQLATAERNFDQRENFSNRARQQDYPGADYRSARNDSRPTSDTPDRSGQVAHEENKYTAQYQPVDFPQQEIPPGLLAEVPSEADHQYSSHRPHRRHRDTEAEFNPESAREMHRHIRNRGGAMHPAGEFDAQSTQKSARGFLLPVVGLLLITCLSLYAARNSVAKMNLPEPVLGTFCGVMGCQLPTQSDVSRLELMRRRMYNHPTLDNVLVISVDLINRAPFPQPYPVLAITMTNSEGTPVANRDFSPAEYQPPELIAELLPARKPVRVKFEIVDPAVDAQSFELEFR